MLNFRSFLSGLCIILSFILLTGCNLMSFVNSDAADTEDNEAQTEIEQPSVEIEEAQVEDEVEDMEFVTCPTKGETLYLSFDHSLTIEMNGVNLTHLLHNKWIYIYSNGENADGVTDLSSGSPVELTYEMLGVMANCSVEMEGVMLASASGTCQDGVVYLDIIEDWQPGSGQMVCDDSTIPFQSPGQAYEHTGDNGLGEKFYLVAGDEGFTTMRPFQAGSGYHTWILYSQLVDAVPLVP